MSEIDIERRKPTASRKPTPRLTQIPVAAIIAVACIGLAACGSSKSSSSTTATQAAATGPANAPGSPGAQGGRFAELRECLQKNGITLPKRAPGTHPRGGAGGFLGGGPAGGGPKLPNGVTRAQYRAALKKCGGSLPKGRPLFGTPGRRNQALTMFAACMRQNGVNVPSPNTSGKGPIFSTKGLDTTSAQFKSALAKCRADLGAGLGRRGGAPPSGEAGGAG